MNSQNPELRLDVLCWQRKEGRPFVGQCLQYDVAVQATTIEDLKRRFARAMVGYFMDRAVNGDDIFEMKPAPQRFWDLAASGKIDSDDLPIYVPSVKTQVRANFRVAKNGPVGTAEACA